MNIKHPAVPLLGRGCGRMLFLLILTIFAMNTTKAKKQRNNVEHWPDGTVIDNAFLNTTKIDINTLGRQYVITDYGVTTDSTIVQTTAIQAVIDRAYADGGGVIVIPEGTFLSGSLFFRQGTHLHVIGKLKGSDRIRDFRLLDTRIEGQTRKYFAALINADGLDGFVIAGNHHINMPKAGELMSEYGYTASQSCLDGNGRIYWEEFRYRRLYNPQCTNLEALRPRLVYISNSKNVTVQDMQLINSPFWTNHLYRCQNVRYLGNLIYAQTKGIIIPGDSHEYGGPSTDAIDIDVCHDILIDHCYMQVNDDAVVIKGGKGTWADTLPENGPVFNVMIQNCNYGVVHGCLTLGSESLHDWNIVLRNTTFTNANRVLWLKMRPDTPQHYEHVTLDNLTGTCTSFLVIRPWTQFFNLEERKDMPHSQCHDILISNVKATSQNFFDVGTSEKYALRRFSFINCDITDQAKAFHPTTIPETTVNNMTIR